MSAGYVIAQLKVTNSENYKEYVNKVKGAILYTITVIQSIKKSNKYMLIGDMLELGKLKGLTNLVQFLKPLPLLVL